MLLIVTIETIWIETSFNWTEIKETEAYKHFLRKWRQEAVHHQ